MTASTAAERSAAPSSLTAVPRAMWIALGTLGIATAGMGGALIARSAGPSQPAALSQPATPAFTSTTPALSNTLAPVDLVPAAQPQPVFAPVAAAPAPTPRPVTYAAKPAPVRTVHTTPRPIAVSAPAAPTVIAQAPAPAPVAPQPVYTQPVEPVAAPAPVYTQAQPVRAAVCYSCGTVEAVHAVQEQGQGTGLGAIAGGVLGGVLGNQVGGGSGKKAMTVVGALGGAYGGHVLEQRMRGQTTYDVSVRMEDGTVRTVRQPQAMPVGTRVTMEGGTLRVAGSPAYGGSGSSGASAGVPVLRTSTFQ